jgi:hypothetical protein
MPSEQGGGGADIGPDDVGAGEPEGVGGADDELAHRPRRQQRVAALRMTEPGQVDRHQVRVLGEPPPYRLERQQAEAPMPIASSISYAVRSCARASTLRRPRRSHSP